MNRNLGIALFFLASVGFAFALYWFFFRTVGSVDIGGGTVVNQTAVNAGLTPSTNATAGANVNGGGGGLGAIPTPGANVNAGGAEQALPPGVSPVALGGITQTVPIGSPVTYGATVSPSGDVNYYDRNTGQFFGIGADGTAKLLTNVAYPNASNVTFDPQGSKAVVEFPDGANILFDFNTNKPLTLPPHWEDFGFTASGEQFVAKSLPIDDTAKYLVVSNADGSGARAVQELGANASKVQTVVSPTGAVVATATTGKKLGVDRQEVFLVGQNSENYKSLTVEGLNFEAKWAPSGRQLLYDATSSSSSWKPLLWIVDGEGDSIGANRRSINLNTWVDKCGFADDTTLYCGVPRDLREGAGLDRRTDAQIDDIYRVDLTTGLTSLVATPEGLHTVGSVMVSPDQSALYFTDKVSGQINKIKLK